jgi:hypothetical protein
VDVPEVAVCIKWYQSGIFFVFYSRGERKFTMPPRRERQSPDPEDREVRRRGRPAGNPEMERQMRDLRARLKDMEIAQRRTASAGDLSDSEGKVEVEPQGEVAAEDAANERLIKAITQMSSKTKMDIPAYEGKSRCRRASRLD